MKPLEILLEELVAKGEALGDAMAHEQQLEDERPLLKEMAIIRIMERDKCAATPAEKIVKSDLEYMNHRIAQRASVVARFRAEAEYEAAKAAATQASLITPSMIELQAKNTALEVMLKASKRETDLRETALRRANGYLADRIRDNEEMGRQIQKLTGQLEIADRTIDRLEQREVTGAAVEGV